MDRLRTRSWIALLHDTEGNLPECLWEQIAAYLKYYCEQYADSSKDEKEEYIVIVQAYRKHTSF